MICKFLVYWVMHRADHRALKKWIEILFFDFENIIVWRTALSNEQGQNRTSLSSISSAFEPVSSAQCLGISTSHMICKLWFWTSEPIWHKVTLLKRPSRTKTLEWRFLLPTRRKDESDGRAWHSAYFKVRLTLRPPFYRLGEAQGTWNPTQLDNRPPPPKMNSYLLTLNKNFVFWKEILRFNLVFSGRNSQREASGMASDSWTKRRYSGEEREGSCHRGPVTGVLSQGSCHRCKRTCLYAVRPHDDMLNHAQVQKSAKPISAATKLSPAYRIR